MKTFSVDSKRTGENLILSAYPKKKVTWEPMHSSTMKAADFSGPGWLTRCVRISQFNRQWVSDWIGIKTSNKQIVVHQKRKYPTAILGCLFSIGYGLNLFFWDSFILLILHPYCWWFRNPIRNHLGCSFQPHKYWEKLPGFLPSPFSQRWFLGKT